MTRSEPELVLMDVVNAIGMIDAGRPVDVDRLRCRVTAAADQLRGLSVDIRADDEGRGAGEYLAIVVEALHRAVDRLAAGDLAGARKAARDSLWAPHGLGAPDELPPPPDAA